VTSEISAVASQVDRRPGGFGGRPSFVCPGQNTLSNIWARSRRRGRRPGPTRMPHRHAESIPPYSAVRGSHKRKSCRSILKSTGGHIIFRMHPHWENVVSSSGVYWDGGKYKWASSINTASEGGGRAVHLGWFVDEVEAALAYDQAADIFHGDEAELNFPPLAPPSDEPYSSEEPPPSSQPSHPSRRKTVWGEQKATTSHGVDTASLIAPPDSLVFRRPVRRRLRLSPRAVVTATGARTWTRRGCGRGPQSFAGAGRPHATLVGAFTTSPRGDPRAKINHSVASPGVTRGRSTGASHWHATIKIKVPGCRPPNSLGWFATEKGAAHAFKEAFLRLQAAHTPPPRSSLHRGKDGRQIAPQGHSVFEKTS
jgi:hypothetical protein